MFQGNIRILGDFRNFLTIFSFGVAHTIVKGEKCAQLDINHGQMGLVVEVIKANFKIFKIYRKIFSRFTSMLSQQMYELTIQPYVPRFTCGQRKLGLLDSMVRV